MIIGLVGTKGVGKSFVANVLVQEFNAKEFAFARHLKNVIKYAWKDINIPVDDPVLKERPVIGSVTPRQIMQKLGDTLRELDPNFFIRTLRDEITSNLTVVSDVRLPEEARIIKQLGGILIRIVSTRGEQISDKHKTEQLQWTIDPDFLYVNQFESEEDDWMFEKAKTKVLEFFQETGLFK